MGFEPAMPGFGGFGVVYNTCAEGCANKTSGNAFKGCDYCFEVKKSSILKVAIHGTTTLH